MDTVYGYEMKQARPARTRSMKNTDANTVDETGNRPRDHGAKILDAEVKTHQYLGIAYKQQGHSMSRFGQCFMNTSPSPALPNHRWVAVAKGDLAIYITKCPC